MAAVGLFLRHPLDTLLTIPPQVLLSLQWWCNPNPVMEGVSFVAPWPTESLVLDASDLSWGAHLEALQNSRLWSREELSLHINRELRAICLVCAVFLPYLSGRVVQLLTESTASMFYVNRQGGARASVLCQEALCLWDF